MIKKVVLIGDLCQDIFMHISDYPEKGGDGLAKKLVKQVGGSVSNTAIALAHLGIESHLITHCGKDIWSQQVLSVLSDEGVNIEKVVCEENESTGMTFAVVTEDGERTLFTYRGANVLLSPDEILPEHFSDISMLHISGYACMAPPQSHAVMKAVELARSLNKIISIDIGMEPARQSGHVLEIIIPKLTMIITGVPEAVNISGKESITEAVNYFFERGVKIVCLKMGKDGCLLNTYDQQVEICAFQVDVVDTTGAGDAFSAAMIYGLLNNWSLQMSGLFANAMGAMTAARWGAGAALPTKQQIIEFLRQHEKTEDKNTIIGIIKELYCG